MEFGCVLRRRTLGTEDQPTRSSAEDGKVCPFVWPGQRMVRYVAA